MTVLSVGTFTFAESGPIVAYPLANVPRAIVEDAYRRTVLPLALQAMGDEVLHASAVESSAGIAAFCAVSGTGKSTIAYALGRAGFALWSDDAVDFRITPERVEALPIPFTIRLRPESVDYLGANGVDGPVVPSASVVGTIFLLKRSPRLEITELSPADAFPSVLTHAYCFDLEDAERKRDMMEAYLHLVERIPVYEVEMPTGLENLESVVQELTDVMA